MSIYQGDTKVSGNARVSSDLPLFFPAYLPNHPNNASWLWADPFSWHSAAVYVAAYNHLVSVVNGVTAQTETIAGISITYYRGNDGLKIVLADQLSVVNAIYNATGIGFYFILDTTNQQFKLPRNIYGFTGHRGAVGNYVEESLPNIRGYFRMNKGEFEDATGAFSRGGAYNIYAANGSGSQAREINFAASATSATYKDGAAVQQRATQAYLYFYVGNTVQDATTVAVGQITEALNGKVDLPTGRTQTSVGLLVESYSNGTSWYRVYSDGWCEQGGQVSVGSAAWLRVTFLKPFTNTNYNIQASYLTTTGSFVNSSIGIIKYANTYADMSVYGVGFDASWRACGYIS